MCAVISGRCALFSAESAAFSGNSAVSFGDSAVISGSPAICCARQVCRDARHPHMEIVQSGLEETGPCAEEVAFNIRVFDSHGETFHPTHVTFTPATENLY